MVRVDSSVQNFIQQPDLYLLKVTYGKGGATLTADKKGIWTWIKARFYEWLGYGTYELSRVCHAIQTLDAVPEHTPLRQAANKVIAKWNSIHEWSIERFDQYQVTLRPHIELTLEKILEIANKELREDDPQLTQDLGFSFKGAELREIKRVCNDGLLEHPEIYMNRWIRERDESDGYCIPQDSTCEFFKSHIFTVR